jgi:hypothetical protein
MRTRNKIVTMLALGAMAVPLAVCGEYFAPLHAEARDVAPRLEGSWEVTVMPDGGEPIVDVGTFTSGGGIINSDPDPNLSTGHGTWVRTGAHQFAVTFVSFLSDQGVPLGTVKVRAEIQLDTKTDTFSGPFRTDVFIDGNLVQSFCGTVQATRINVEPLEPCP